VLAFDADGSRLASADDDLTIRIWDTTWGQELLSLPWSESFPTELCFSPDRQWLAGRDFAGRTMLWDARPLPEPAYPTWPPTVEQLSAQIEAGRDDAEVWMQRGLGLARRREAALAADDLARALALAPDDASIGRALADQATLAGRWDHVVAACNALATLEPQESRWPLLGGEALARLRRFDEAAGEYARGEALVGNNLELMCAAAGLKLLAGDADGYLAAFDQARTRAIQSGWIDPSHGNASRNAYLLARMAAYAVDAPLPAEQWVAWAQQGAAASARGSWSRHALGMALLRTGQPREAIAALEESVAADPNWCRGLNELALALAYEGEGDAAEAQRRADAAIAETAWAESAATDRPLQPQGWHLHDWIELHLLRREVVAMRTP
jgi:tetratricopeptide (TPR) repeat protein